MDEVVEFVSDLLFVLLAKENAFSAFGGGIVIGPSLCLTEKHIGFVSSLRVILRRVGYRGTRVRV